MQGGQDIEIGLRDARAAWSHQAPSECSLSASTPGWQDIHMQRAQNAQGMGTRSMPHRHDMPSQGMPGQGMPGQGPLPQSMPSSQSKFMSPNGKAGHGMHGQSMSGTQGVNQRGQGQAVSELQDVPYEQCDPNRGRQGKPPGKNVLSEHSVPMNYDLSRSEGPSTPLGVAQDKYADGGQQRTLIGGQFIQNAWHPMPNDTQQNQTSGLCTPVGGLFNLNSGQRIPGLAPGYCTPSGPSGTVGNYFVVMPVDPATLSSMQVSEQLQGALMQPQGQMQGPLQGQMHGQTMQGTMQGQQIVVMPVRGMQQMGGNEMFGNQMGGNHVADATR